MSQISEDTVWLLGLDREPRPHRCGRCATPYGVSALPCPNDGARRESDRLARIQAWKQARNESKGAGK